MQVLVNRNQRGSPDGIKINVYKAGKTYGPTTNPPMPADLATVFLREGWGEAIEDAANRKRGTAAANRKRTGKGTFRPSDRTTSAATGQPERTSTAKASASGTNRGAAEDASRVQVHAPAPAREAPAGPEPAAACLWCGATYRRRTTGGSTQRFCATECRSAFHLAARRWALRQIDEGCLEVGGFLRELCEQRVR